VSKPETGRMSVSPNGTKIWSRSSSKVTLLQLL
jgi:hypothetical protein